MFPIILAHGIARFDILLEIQRERFDLPNDPLSDEFQYFKGITTHLQAHSFQHVFSPNEDFAGPVKLRAAQLKTHVNDVLAQTGEEKVHIIAHSMGGLDARHMIVELEMGGRVASLTTIGTPHLGTILADRVLGLGGFLLLDLVKKAFRLDLDGFRDLTVSECLAFNELAAAEEAANEVFYQTYASFEDIDDVFLPLVPSWLVINKKAGQNDGLVPYTSARWTDQLLAADGRRKNVVRHDFPMPADHLNQIGWWDFEEIIDPATGGDLLTQKIHFENRIKELYLQIALDLQSRFG